MSLPAFFCVPLERHPAWRAHVRSADLSVILTRDGAHTVSARLFDAHARAVAEGQEERPPAGHKRTFTVYLVLTDGCNLACTYCDVLGRPEDRGPGRTMTAETALRALDVVLDRLRAEPDLSAQVVFFGGEPLLAWPVLVRLCEALEAAPEGGRVARMLVTNGTLLTEERASFLGRHRVYTVVSVDGSPAVHDRVRPTHRGEGSFDGVRRGLEVLGRVLPGRFGISTTVGSHNAATLADEVSWLQRTFSPCCIGVNLYHPQRDGRVPIETGADAVADAMVATLRRAREEGIAIYQYIGLLRAFSRQRRNLDYCPACVDKLLFTPDGRVGRCETLASTPGWSVPVETLDRWRLPDTLDWTRFTPEHEPACLACAERWICPGSCAYDQIVRTGEPSGTDPRRCLVHRRLFRELLDLLADAAFHARGTAVPDVLVPTRAEFAAVLGRIPTAFPTDTIWIVSLSGVNDTCPGGAL